MKKPKMHRLLGLLLVAVTCAISTGNAQRPPDNAASAASQGATNTLEAPDQGTTNTSAASSEGSNEERSEWERHGNPLVVIGHDVDLKAGETAEAVVVIGGSAIIHGKVHDAAVVIFGDLDVEGEVGEAVVVMGDLKLGPNARIHHETVAVGGKLDADTAAKLGEPPVTVDFPNWLKTWFKQCFLKLRPLAPQVGWVWAIAGVIFLLYVVIAALFPRPVEISVSELSRRPATTFLIGLLTKILAPLVIIILAATGIGLIVIPFVIAALILCAVVGKVALLQWLGFKLGRHFGTDGLRNPLIALLLGTIILILFYIVPVVGLLTFAITAVWGLGAGVTAAFGAFRKELPEKPAAPAAPMSTPTTPDFTAGPGTPAVGMGGAAGFSEPSSANFSASGASEGGTATMTAPAAAPLVMPETLSYPKAGFWERMAAGFLDFVLVGIVGALAHPILPLVALAYFTGLWAWKGTTIGGIVLGLKVVRHDGGDVSFLVGLVRALAATFSMVVLFLGFLWIAWDSEKQGWHDKIAGTVVLKLPRGTPLLML